MKKKMATLCTATALTCLAAFPSLAAENKTEYKEAATPIYSEFKELNEEMKPLLEEKKAIAEKYKSIRMEKKNTGNLSISKENWQKAKELRNKIKEIRNSQDKQSARVLRAEAKSARKDKNYNDALDSLEQALELKKSRLENLKEINDIWKQIDVLLKQ